MKKITYRELAEDNLIYGDLVLLTKVCDDGKVRTTYIRPSTCLGPGEEFEVDFDEELSEYLKQYDF